MAVLLTETYSKNRHNTQLLGLVWFVLWIVPGIQNSRSSKIPTFGWVLQGNPRFLEKENSLLLFPDSVV